MKHSAKIAAALLAGTMAVSLGLTGCGEQSAGTEPSQATSQATQQSTTKADSLTIAITNDENTLAPYTYVSGTGLVANRLIYDTLLTIDKDNNIIPWMVDDYTVSDDSKVYTMKLLDGQKFHNGNPVTAEDVKFSFEYAADKNVAGLRKIADKVEKIETPDEQTIIFTLKNTDINFARDGLAVMRIINKDVYDGVTDPTTVKESIGSGMYKLVEYKTGEYYKLEAVEDYFRGAPQVSKINMPIVTDATAVQQGILSGEFAASTSTISVEVVDTFKNTPNLEVYSNDGYAPTILNFNNGEEAMQDVKFRQALSYAIDVNDICKTLYGDYATVGTKGLIRSDMDYSVSGLEYVHDVEKAAQLLDELGYTEKNGDGYRFDKNGKVLDFDILTYSGNTIRARIAELAVEDLKEVGIKATVKSMEMDTVDAYVWPDFEVSKGRDYDMSTWGWSSSNTPTFLVSLCSSDYSIGTYNVMGYKSDNFDQIVTDQYSKVTSMDQMTSMLKELQTVVADEIPCLVIAYPDSLQVCNTQHSNGWESGKGLNIVNVFSFLAE